MEDICVVDVYHGKVLFVTSLSVKGAGLVNFRLQVVFPVTCKKVKMTSVAQRVFNIENRMGTNTYVFDNPEDLSELWISNNGRNIFAFSCGCSVRTAASYFK